VVTMEITKQDWIRLAAFIDGEGSIYIKPLQTKSARYNQLVIHIANTDPRLPCWCQETFGGKVYRCDSNQRLNGDQQKIAYSWRIFSKNAENIIRGCLPYFLLKREQAEVALAYRATFRYRTGHGSAQLLTEEELNIRQSCLLELKRLKRELPDAAVEHGKATLLQ
jgi:hypothetical protein